jgi:hypothetical protein
MTIPRGMQVLHFREEQGAKRHTQKKSRQKCQTRVLCMLPSAAIKTLRQD